MLREYIESVSGQDQALHLAGNEAQEVGLAVPDTITGGVLATLACTTQAQAMVAITPAADVVGLHLLKGAGEQAVLTCIDPEPEHQQRARSTFRAAGFPAHRVRYLPSRPLEVLGRLAKNTYQVIYAEVSPIDLKALIDTALPLLSEGGCLVLADALLDGTLNDETRTDRETASAREAEAYISELEGVVLARLPLGAGMVILSKHSGS
ncbi:O-methyltransferase [Corynebacterium gerontici]|uniref:O-methyltransferase n=1 Tax=Corynebacterium gerontici TaxID=2079234 RepID=A0A3G6J2G7_9CORY|nr:O-methyltransferase [Corynebacterium gerontici]AZA11168.1 Putative O-methyltransferase [Corynebacterium gerontici]